MIRGASAIALAFALSLTVLHAQEVAFTISVPSADVHKGPSTATPVIAHVERGKTLAVVRNLGSWVKVPWPDAPEGVAYVHVTMGRLTPPPADAASTNTSPRGSSAPGAAVTPAPSPIAGQTATVPQHRPVPRERVVVSGQQGGVAISHIFGAGAVVGSMDSIGATARAWRANRLGFQVGFTRDALTSDTAAGHVTALQIEPAVVYGLSDFVTDYFWVRPYIGSGVSIRHQTLHASTSTPSADVASDTGVGFRGFGGAELTFAGAPRFALGVEAGYRKFPTPFPGFAANHLGVSIFGDWYIK